MAFIHAHILCNRDTRTEEDLQLAEQFAKLELKVDLPSDKVIQEWRPAKININHIACYYPHAEPKHTMIHLFTGSVLTVLECFSDIDTWVREGSSNSPYSYTAVINTKSAAVES